MVGGEKEQMMERPPSLTDWRSRFRVQVSWWVILRGDFFAVNLK